MHNTMLNHLTDNYNKDPNSNIGKLFSVIGGEMEEFQESLNLIHFWRDIDNAVGITLDRIGGNVLEYRGGKTDDEYRNYIKIRIVANLSQGDIETLNTVASFLLEDNFLGFEETWHIEDYDDVAGLFGEVSINTVKIPSILDKVRAGGVRIYWERVSLMGGFNLWDDSYSYPVFYKDCGWFSGLKWYKEYLLQTINMENDTYDYKVAYYVNEKKTSYINMGSFLMPGNSYDFIKKFQSTGELETIPKGTSIYSKKLNLKEDNYNYGIFYDVNEKFFMNMTMGELGTIESTYEYPKRFESAGELEPLSKATSTLSGRIFSYEESYLFPKYFNTCGEFYASK